MASLDDTPTHIDKKQRIQDEKTNEHSNTNTEQTMMDTNATTGTDQKAVFPFRSLSPSLLSRLPLQSLYVLFDYCPLATLTQFSITCRTVCSFLDETPGGYGQYYYKMRAFTQMGEAWYAALIHRHCQVRRVGLRAPEDAEAYEAELVTLTAEERSIERARDHQYSGWSWRQHLVWETVTSQTRAEPSTTIDAFERHRTAWIGVMKERKRKTEIQLMTAAATAQVGPMPPSPDDDDQDADVEADGDVNADTTTSHPSDDVQMHIYIDDQSNLSHYL